MSNSVLQSWVMELPLRFQGTLLTAVRGCEYDCSEVQRVAEFPPPSTSEGLKVEI